MPNTSNDGFELYNLHVEISDRSGKIIGKHAIGDYFDVIGEDIFIPEGQGFSLYALGSMLALLPAKQRVTSELDWMTSDEYIADPDPNCQAVYKITRTGKTFFKRSDVTDTPPPSIS